MASIITRLKKFDVHVKTVDGVNQQTTVGALITVLCVILTASLLISETMLFMSRENVHHMVVDQGNTHDTVRLDVDVEFHSLSCEDVSFSQEVVRGTVHHTGEPNITFTPLSQGCRVAGYIVTDRIGGNFRFHVRSDEPVNHDFRPPLTPRQPRESDPDMSHTINRMSFLPVKEERVDSLQYDHPVFKLATKSPLSNTHTKLQKGIGMYHYGLHIVPTHKKKAGKVSVSRLDKISITERAVKISDINRGVSLGGSMVKDFIGVIVTYDFYPVTILIDEKKEGVLEFITSLCAILGGVITMMSLLNRCLYSSVKVMIGKKD
mmetsp:Transcript_13119/g.19764  ORF Transcript_13119/g.19764 Transcript_13119/m.19764 type:complete len:320 (+) Transcript_13119:115-1074(+)